MKKKELKNVAILMDKLQRYRIKCKCGHTLTLITRKYEICSWCGRKVYRSKKDEFEDKLKKELKK